jgi:predicted N-acetyltransferase YhbS
MACQLRLAPERAADAPLVEGLISRAFGPGRFVKSAERLREGRAPNSTLSFIAWMGEAAVGCVRLWPIALGETPALLLGPFAVDEAYRSAGVGAALIQKACDAATREGHALILLVGDEPYYAPLGFSSAPARNLVMPGPVDQRRVLVRPLVQGAEAGLTGSVRR